MNESISLSQKLYLLGIHPKKGGIISSSYTAMDFVLLGSLLMELYQQKNIAIEGNKIVVVQKRSENKLHQFILDKMAQSSISYNIRRWIGKLNLSIKHIRKEIRKELYHKRYIGMHEKRFLFFRWEIPVLLNKQAVYKMLRILMKENQFSQAVASSIAASQAVAAAIAATAATSAATTAATS